MSNDGLSTDEKVNLLFKNYMNFTSTLDSKAFFEETALANNTNIFSDNILSSTPSTNPTFGEAITSAATLSSLLETGIPDISINDTWVGTKTVDGGTFQKDASSTILRLNTIKLDYVTNGGASFICKDNEGNNILQNLIPSNYAASGYSLSLEYNDGSSIKSVPWLAPRGSTNTNGSLSKILGTNVSFGGALFDAKNGVVTFYDVNGDPNSVFSSAEFYLSATKYIGPKGAAASGSGGGGTDEAAVKALIDASLNAHYYTQTYIDGSLNAVRSDIDTSLNTNYHTQTYIDGSLNAVRNYIDTSLNTNYHTQTYIDGSLNVVRSYIDTSLNTNYHNKSYIDSSLNNNYHTQSYIDDSLNAVRNYIDTSLNTNYHTQTYIDGSLNAVSNYIDTSLNTNYHTQTYIDGSLNAVRSDIDTSLNANYHTQTYIDGSLNAVRSDIDTSLNAHYITHNAQGDVVMSGDVVISGKLNVEGSINFTGDFIKTDTVVRITEQIDVSNDGTGPALKITQHGVQPVAEFYDDADLVMVIKNGGDVSFNNNIHVEGTISGNYNSASIPLAAVAGDLDTSLNNIRTYIDNSLNANYHTQTYIDTSINNLRTNISDVAVSQVAAQLQEFTNPFNYQTDFTTFDSDDFGLLQENENPYDYPISFDSDITTFDNQDFAISRPNEFAASVGDLSINQLRTNQLFLAGELRQF
jgi:hypothetical protein